MAAGSPLYGWFDLGAGGAYSSQDTTQPVASGHGYWAWFPCPRAMSVSGDGSPSATSNLGAYHASMVGNPSGGSQSTVAGYDYAARWDPALNGGAGGYHLSGYRQAQTLAVGEGIWVFSYDATTITIGG